MRRIVVFLVILAVVFVALSSPANACKPSKGCSNKENMCMRLNKWMSKCFGFAKQLPALAGYCDVNHQDACDADEKCDVVKGRCKHVCDPACPADQKCGRVWIGLKPKHRCITPGSDCGGACGEGYNCIFGGMCVKVPSGVKSVGKALAFAAGKAMDRIGGFFTSGKKLLQKDADKAAPGDTVAVENDGKIAMGDMVAFDTRESKQSEIELDLSSKGNSAEELADYNALDYDTYDNGDNYDDDAYPLEDWELPTYDEYDSEGDGEEEEEEVTPAAYNSSIEVQSRAIHKQDFFNGLKSLVFTLVRCAVKLVVAAFDVVTIALDAGMTALNTLHAPVKSVIAIGGSGGALEKTVSSYGVRLQEKDINAPPSRIGLPRKMTGGGVLDGSATVDIMGDVSIVVNDKFPPNVTGQGQLQSLGRASIQADGEVKITQGVALSSNGSVLTTGDNATFTVEDGGEFRYSGNSFAPKVVLNYGSILNLTAKAARMADVSVLAGGLLRISSHHIKQMPTNDISPDKRVGTVNAVAAVTVGQIDKCEDGAAIVFRLRGGDIDEMSTVYGPVIKFKKYLNDSQLRDFWCTIVLETGDGELRYLYTTTPVDDEDVETLQRIRTLKLRRLSLLNKLNRLEPHERIEFQRLAREEVVHLQAQRERQAREEEEAMAEVKLQAEGDGDDAGGDVGDDEEIDEEDIEEDFVWDGFAVVEADGISMEFTPEEYNEMDLVSELGLDSGAAKDEGSSMMVIAAGAGAAVLIGAAVTLFVLHKRKKARMQSTTDKMEGNNLEMSKVNRKGAMSIDTDGSTPRSKCSPPSPQPRASSASRAGPSPSNATRPGPSPSNAPRPAPSPSNAGIGLAPPTSPRPPSQVPRNTTGSRPPSPRPSAANGNGNGQSRPSSSGPRPSSASPRPVSPSVARNRM